MNETTSRHEHEQGYADHERSRNNPNTVGHRSDRTSHAVHDLMGPEMEKQNGVREMTDRLYDVPENNPARSQKHNQNHYAPAAPENQFREMAGSDFRSVEQPNISDDRLVKNALSVGVVAGSASAVAGSLSATNAFIAGGTVAGVGMLAAAPLAGGTVGYFVGKKLHHPVVGAATGAAIGSISLSSALHAINVGAITQMFGATSLATAGASAGTGLLSATGAAVSMWPAAVGAALTYGLGEAHNYLWKKEGRERPGIAGTFLRGLVAPVTIPIGLDRKAFGGGK